MNDYKRIITDGLKPKDLIGIPWSVAKALRDPYYSGRIADEKDRVWLAATIDAEGTICGFDMIRNDDGEPRTGVNITITNSSERLLNNAQRIWSAQKYKHDNPKHLGNLPMYRWQLNGIEEKMNLLQEIYPYLVVKKDQAILAYNLMLFMARAKRDGHTPQMQEIRDKRSYLVSQISNANKQIPFDIPSWCIEPPSMYEPGWYLRQDIIWAKPNPMPESVKDRCTKSHEYIFLLAKSQKYYYDADAIQEKANPLTQRSTSVKATEAVGNTSKGDRRVNYEKNRHTVDFRNRRSVWTVTTKPFKGAHFATFPPDLIEPCILAGSAKGDTVLDPFNGAGTTGAVAIKHHRDYIGIELNPKYIKLTEKRLRQVQPVLTEVVE